jgi:selenocysteine lyase/cysteine desulfurase
MTTSDPKRFYSRFLEGHPGTLHFAAHSHHFWPDVTREAHLAYWDDCAQLSDEKWGRIFGTVIPAAQSHVARLLNLRDPRQIVFAPNTHELAARILSLFYGRRSLRVLTTGSEFHSWRRQLNRLAEDPAVRVDVVSTEALLWDRAAFVAALRTRLETAPDLFFVSQVFFDSGLALTDDELRTLAEACPEETVLVVDGYHGFGALPTDLSGLEGRIFYLGGGYKYAQAGEGDGFLVVPKGDWRPAYTGWFAEFGELSRPPGTETGYTTDGMAFIGATQDPSGLYRFNAVWDLFLKENLTVAGIHEYVLNLQNRFLGSLPERFIEDSGLTPLIPEELTWHGHFLTFEAPSEERARTLEDALKARRIIIDRRGKRLRFGFGLYQNETDVGRLCDLLQGLT